MSEQHTTDRTLTLEWHLQNNFYPPITLKVIPLCEAALDAANRGEPDALLDLPDGTQITAAQVIEDLRLEDFAEGDNA